MWVFFPSAFFVTGILVSLAALVNEIGWREGPGKGRPVAIVADHEGELSRNRVGHYSWSEARNLDAFYNREALETGEGSWARLSVAGRSELEVEESSLIVFDDLSPSGFYLQSGSAWIGDGKGKRFLSAGSTNQASDAGPIVSLLAPRIGTKLFTKKLAPREVRFSWSFQAEAPEGLALSLLHSALKGSSKQAPEIIPLGSKNGGMRSLRKGSYTWRLEAKGKPASPRGRFAIAEAEPFALKSARKNSDGELELSWKLPEMPREDLELGSHSIEISPARTFEEKVFSQKIPPTGSTASVELEGFPSGAYFARITSRYGDLELSSLSRAFSWKARPGAKEVLARSKPGSSAVGRAVASKQDKAGETGLAGSSVAPVVVEDKVALPEVSAPLAEEIGELNQSFDRFAISWQVSGENLLILWTERRPGFKVANWEIWTASEKGKPLNLIKGDIPADWSAGSVPLASIKPEELLMVVGRGEPETGRDLLSQVVRYSEREPLPPRDLKILYIIHPRSPSFYDLTPAQKAGSFTDSISVFWSNADSVEHYQVRIRIPGSEDLIVRPLGSESKFYYRLTVENSELMWRRKDARVEVEMIAENGIGSQARRSQPVSASVCFGDVDAVPGISSSDIDLIKASAGVASGISPDQVAGGAVPFVVHSFGVNSPLHPLDLNGNGFVNATYVPIYVPVHVPGVPIGKVKIDQTDSDAAKRFFGFSCAR